LLADQPRALAVPADGRRQNDARPGRKLPCS